MIFVLLFLTVGLVVSVRFVLKRVKDSFLAGRAPGAPAEPREAEAPQSSGSSSLGEESAYDEGSGPTTGRELKERYLRGEMSKDEYERRLRALQLDEYLKGRQ